ncbi:CRISPR-associated protein Cas4 [Candidatus Stoquefichus massiliensis]|uniref:CRISPR-associated protein Cas4 n=1 Tax=Candidatus Stoquefichus massiliensis TaxID=1470350 RepID=UPI000482A050|nr:CRISPR-associated protein Cas4 [Candidatus Stoquefichus massiliensis]
MKVNGTLMNYYIHCPRQCYLHAHRLNLENNSEDVKVGKALHESKYLNDVNAEIAIENIRLDKLTKEYLTETKKSDADVEASRWQLIFYLYKLKEKGVERKGKLEFIQKNKEKKTVIIELDEQLETELLIKINEIEKLLKSEQVPSVIEKKHCKKCAYYEYCYI